VPRTVRDAKLDTRSARFRLAARREPYWRSISDRLAIGYRKGAKGGTWIARHYTPEAGRRFNALGTTDDVADADGVHVLTFGQAQEAARAWFAALARQDRNQTIAGPYTVGQALNDYVADYKRRGGKAVDRLEAAIRAHLRPTLGSVALQSLTRHQVERWHTKLAEAPPRLRTAPGKRQQYADLDTSADGLRRRRSTANRVLTILKAALNLARQNRRIDTDDAWAMAKPYREVDAPKIRYLSDDETRRLVNACPPHFRALVTAALLTGARYGELAAMTAGDYSRDSGTVYIGRSKGGKARHVYLSAEGVEFFEAAAGGKGTGDLLFPRADGKPWQHTHQFRPMRAACEAAKIAPAIGFHILRHTHASRLAIKGVASAVIAAQLGHSDTRMTERHYAHLAPSYIGETLRAAFTSIGIIEPTNATSIASRNREDRK
jgi:integrase